MRWKDNIKKTVDSNFILSDQDIGKFGAANIWLTKAKEESGTFRLEDLLKYLHCVDRLRQPHFFPKVL